MTLRHIFGQLFNYNLGTLHPRRIPTKTATVSASITSISIRPPLPGTGTSAPSWAAGAGSTTVAIGGSRVGGDLLSDRVFVRDLDRGDGDRRAGDGARSTDVGVCDLVLDRPREGDLETMSNCVGGRDSA